ncbi:hypothetical protein Taro_044851, partial [Colocasia esculenta]|nr:hypothetical protein [Colocasia esculenta]
MCHEDVSAGPSGPSKPVELVAGTTGPQVSVEEAVVPTGPSDPPRCEERLGKGAPGFTCRRDPSPTHQGVKRGWGRELRVSH